MSAIILDFDGTISNSFDYVSAFLAAEAKLPPLTEQQKNELRNMSMGAMARKLGHPWWRLPSLFFRGRRVMSVAIKQVQPYDGMIDVIQKLHAEGHELYIVSSNIVRNLHDFLHRHGLHTYFLELYGGVGLFSKAPALRKLVKEQNLKFKDCAYVGDEMRDIEAAQSVGMKAVAVTWGFAKHEDLQKLKPTAIAHVPADIIRIFEEL